LTDKQLVIEAVSRLPDAASIEAIREEVEIPASIRRGETSADAVKVTPNEEVKKLASIHGRLQGSLERTSTGAASRGLCFHFERQLVSCPDAQQ
jgi:hypothetical protein